MFYDARFLSCDYAAAATAACMQCLLFTKQTFQKAFFIIKHTLMLKHIMKRGAGIAAKPFGNWRRDL